MLPHVDTECSDELAGDSISGQTGTDDCCSQSKNHVIIEELAATVVLWCPLRHCSKTIFVK